MPGLLDALARGAGRYQGIAVVRNDASRAELQDLQAAPRRLFGFGA